MTYEEKLDGNEDIVANLTATWGPETERGYPVDLRIEVDLRWKDGCGYCLSCGGGLTIKGCNGLGLKPISTCGQCLDDSVKYLAESGLRCRTLEKIVPIWKRWHLNDMNAGTVRQSECIRRHKEEHPEWRFDYDLTCKILKEHGLYEDEQYLVDGKPYKYGEGGLFHEIPHEILLELVGILEETMSIEKKEK